MYFYKGFLGVSEQPTSIKGQNFAMKMLILLLCFHAGKQGMKLLFKVFLRLHMYAYMRA